ncbi:LysR family transcriptional regulator, partial [Pseudomonas aeruginosa]
KLTEASSTNPRCLMPLQPGYPRQQNIGVVFLKAKGRDPNLLASLAECRMYSLRLEQEAAG